MHSNRTIVIQDKSVSIERHAFILNGMIQVVYKYWIDGMLVITYYTNGLTVNLNPVYHKLDIWPKTKLDSLLVDVLPIDSN